MITRVQKAVFALVPAWLVRFFLNLWEHVLSRVIYPEVFPFQKDRHLLDKPVFFRGHNGVAVLLIHGWSSVPFEMRPIGEFLHQEGFTVSAPMLSGHGTTPKDLEDARWEDWYRDVREEFKRLKQSHSKVYVGGMSMGGNLAVKLAQEFPSVSGVIAMGTPYGFRNESVGYFFYSVSRIFLKYKSKSSNLMRYLLSNTRPQATRYLSYQSYPLVSLQEAFRGVKISRKGLRNITQPVMLIQSDTDQLIRPDSIDIIANTVSSRHIEKHFVPNGYHNFIADDEGKVVFEDILNFVKKF